MTDRLSQAVAAAVARDRPFASRYQAAGRLLGRRHSRGPRGVTFHDGATSDGRRCDCQEGGHIECLHKIAARLLAESGEDEEDWRPAPFGRCRTVSAAGAARWF